jgi:two-component system C4-dicarboxylate transport response regulator DctD
MNKEYIMIVDDEEYIAILLMGVTSRMGYIPLVFGNGLSAINEYTKIFENVVMVITDITMPGIYGLDLVNRIISVDPNMPVLIITGLVVGDVAGLEKLLENKNIGILPKPFGISEFKEKVEHMISQNK